MKTQDHPGVYLPPPLIYVLLFFISIFANRLFPLPSAYFNLDGMVYLGMGLVLLAITIMLPAVVKFFKTKNTLVTIMPANSLQTTGIYAFTRNPMYLSLLILYTGIGFLKGNFWTFLAIPLLILIITKFVIIKEEKYLNRAFGDAYMEYRKKVRRWI